MCPELLYWAQLKEKREIIMTKRINHTQESYNTKLRLMGLPFEIIGEFTGTKKPTKVKHTTCGKSFDATPTSIKHCPWCKYGRANKIPTTQDVQNIIHTFGHGVKLIGKYICDRSDIKIQYTCGHSVSRNASNLKQGLGLRCLVCDDPRIESNRIHISETNKRISDNCFGRFTIITDSEYPILNITQTIKCNKCDHEFERHLSSFIGGNGHCPWCGKTGKSIQEEFVAMCLTDMGVKYEREIKLFGMNRPVDFFLPELNIVIEYDGEQHKSQKESDISKDAELTDGGTVVHRIDCDESVLMRLMEIIK